MSAYVETLRRIAIALAVQEVEDAERRINAAHEGIHAPRTSFTAPASA